MVGFRIFDVGLLVLWLVWFFRLRDDSDPPEDGGEDEGGGGPPLDPPDPSGDGGLALPLGGVVSQGRRVRDHAGGRDGGRSRRPADHPTVPVRLNRGPGPSFS